MLKKIEALIVFLLTVIASYIIGDIFFELITLIVPIVGLRPVLGGLNAMIFTVLGYYLVDSKYHFEKKGGKMFRSFKLFKK